MTGQETLLQLAREQHEIEPGQSYVIDRFRPEDAFGVARCFFTVYGDAYSLDTVYSPETLIQANADGRLYSIVARSSRGDMLGHCALSPLRSAPASMRRGCWWWSLHTATGQ